MKNRRIKIIAAFLAVSFAFSGCGDALYEMTPEEEAAIVSYASQTVAKFNNFQQDGQIFVMREILNGDKAEAPAEPVADMQETEQPETEQEDSVPVDMPDDTQELQELPDAAEAPEETVSMGEALELGEVSAVYKGNSLCSTYEDSDIYAVDAGTGEQLLVLNIELANQSGQDVHVDLLAAKPVFQAVINETQKAVAQTTILPHDLSTYQEDIAAGASDDTVLIFHIPEDIQEVSGIQLTITMNGNQHTINL